MLKTHSHRFTTSHNQRQCLSQSTSFQRILTFPQCISPLTFHSSNMSSPYLLKDENFASYFTEKKNEVIAITQAPRNILLPLHLKSFLLIPHILIAVPAFYRSLQNKHFSEELSVLIATNISPFLSRVPLNQAFFPTVTPKLLLSQTLLTVTKPRGQSSMLILRGLPATSDSPFLEILSSLGFQKLLSISPCLTG